MERRALLTEHRDILTQPVRSVADEPHLRRSALELVSEDSVKAVELASLDDKRQPTEPRPQRLPIHYWPRRHHRCDCFIEHLAADRAAAPLATASAAGFQCVRHRTRYE